MISAISRLTPLPSPQKKGPVNVDEPRDRYEPGVKSGNTNWVSWRILACGMLGGIASGGCLAGQIQPATSIVTEDLEDVMISLEMTTLARLAQARADGDIDRVNESLNQYQLLFQLQNGIEESRSHDFKVRVKGAKDVQAARQGLERSPFDATKLESLQSWLQQSWKDFPVSSDLGGGSQRMLENLEKLQLRDGNHSADPALASLREATRQLNQQRDKALQLPRGELRERALRENSQKAEELRHCRSELFQAKSLVALWTIGS